MEEWKVKILLYLQMHDKRERKSEDIQKNLKVKSAQDFADFSSAMEDLENEKMIFRRQGNVYETRSQAGVLEGKLTISRSGMGFVDFDDRDTVRVPEGRQSTALSGDMVLVKPDKDSDFGEVVAITSRARDHVIGTWLRQEDGSMPFVPDDTKLQSRRFSLDVPSDFKPTEGLKALFTIEQFGDPIHLRFIQSIGYKDDPGVDITSILLDHEIRMEFPDDVKEQVASMAMEVQPEEREGRVDLREDPTVTIDGDDSKDFDDAVAVHPEGEGWMLKVSIADVSHYVTEGSPLDLEAQKRGFSTYVTDRVVPMLPHELSNGICSLNPHVERLALTCEMKVNSDGTVSSYRVYPSVIRSFERMTYHNVNEILNGNSELQERYAHLGSLFTDLRDCADAIRGARRRKGAIDFASTESEIRLDEKGHPVYVGPKHTGHAEEMIEDCMVAANVCVADYLKGKDVPAVYRVHEQPDAQRLKNFITSSEMLGHKFVPGKDVTPKDIQNYLNSVKDTPEYPVLSMMMLRCMAKARYDSKCLGHFGLAEKEYLHFTSPIRRYPDLIVHRMLRKYVFEHCDDQDQKQTDEAKCQEFADTSSLHERNSTDAEFDADDMKKAEYMMDHVGETFEGIIDGVTGYGFYVQLASTVEGLVHIHELKDDYYQYDESRMELVGRRTKRFYRAGMKVHVIVLAASKDTASVDFGLVGNNGKTASSHPRSRRNDDRRRRRSPGRRYHDRKGSR